MVKAAVRGALSADVDSDMVATAVRQAFEEHLTSEMGVA
jgi:hypothetical protein